MPTSSSATCLPEAFLGGRRHLRKDLAEKAIQDNVATPLGLDLLAAAQGIVRVVNTNMVNAIRAVSVERGIDPRGYLLVAGGAPVDCTPRVLRASSECGKS